MGVAVIGVVFAHNFIIKFVLTAAILFIYCNIYRAQLYKLCRSLWALCGGICCTAKHNYCKGKVVYQDEALRHTSVDHRAAGPASYDNRRLRNDVWQLANDPEVTRYLRWEPHRDWVVTMAYLNEIVKQYDRPDFYDWGICDKVTGVLMGSISIAPAESCEREKPYAWKNVKTELLGGMYEIGYTLGKKWWNQAMPPKPPLPCAITGLAW